VATYPAIAAGQRITTAMLSGLTWNYVVKNGTQTVTSSTTLVNDSDLFFPLEANAQYEWELFMRFSGLQAAGIKLAWTAPAGTSFNRTCGGPGSTNAVQTNANTTEMRWSSHSITTAVDYTNPRNSTGLHTWLTESSIFTAGATAGNLQLQWAQNTSNATGTVVQGSSYIRYRRIG
jgi:hypothetical protein